MVLGLTAAWWGSQVTDLVDLVKTKHTSHADMFLSERDMC